MSTVVERLSLGQTEKILAVISSAYEEVANRTYVCVIDGAKVLLYNKGDSIQLRASFGGRHSMSKANEWNETKRFSKAHVEEDGSIVLEADYLFEGGTTIENLAQFLKIFKASLSVFIDEVV
ncbi:MAG: YbjN domain-containing protein [Cyanobacteria bacterium P01_A01_bin.17]